MCGRSLIGLCFMAAALFGVLACLPGLARGQDGKDAAGDPLPAGAVARLGTTRSERGSAVLCVAFSSDGKTLVSAGEDKTIRLWDLATGRVVASAALPKPKWDRGGNPKTLIVISPDGRALASLSGFEVHLWDLGADGRLTHSLRLDDNDEANCFAFAPDGKSLVTGDGQSGPRLQLWEVPGGKQQRTFGESGPVVVGVAFSPDGKTVVATANGVSCFDVASGKLLWQESEDWGPIAFSPDGQTVVSSDYGLHFRDVAKGRVLFQLDGQYARSIAFSPDGKMFASVGTEVVTHGRAMLSDGAPSFRIWDVSGERLLRTFLSPAGEISAVAFSPDGKTIATAGSDATVLLWDAALAAQKK